MKWLPLYLLIIIWSTSSIQGQQLLLHIKLVDATTAIPIPDAHVFISDSSMGAISDADGSCKLIISSQETQQVIISHVSYETQILDPKLYPSMTEGAVVKMKGNGFDLSQIQVTAKRGKKWKKHFKKFKSALLGEGTPATKCKIVNPEVLRFEEQNGNLKVTAVDLIHIDNDYLGYDISLWLEELIVDADGSKYYKGFGQFTDKENATSKKRKKRREKSYQNSLAHFLSGLVTSPDLATLENKGYQVAHENYDRGVFSQFSTPSTQELIRNDTKPGLYQLHFSEFLAVKHLNLVKSKSGTQVSISGAEQQKFGSDRTQSIGAKKEVAVSRLYKIEPYILFDRRGNIINKAAVKEYNYWADQRLATTLPMDYKKFSDFKDPPDNSTSNSFDTLQVFKNLVGSDKNKIELALKNLRDKWSPGYIAPLFDVLRLSNNDWHQKEINLLLTEKASHTESNYYEGLQALWKTEPTHNTFYPDFKAHIYKIIDPVFHNYFFQRGGQTEIRMDEIVWGGVMQDGIPPLRSPQMIIPDDAKYLSDTDVIFGLIIKGNAYAYPQRILAWHEFFTDTFDDLSIAGVYCTLCGTVIIYNTEIAGEKHELGTSGFLYRSNKLMYDKATQSLWSTMLGRPVVGPLVGKDLEMEILPVETTTWDEWKKKHPSTKVLSLDTGYDRNYDEGEAYKNYYADDALMFPVPLLDQRLDNKARVFIPRTDNYAENPLAISIDYLKKKRLHQDQVGEQDILILTEKNGASRAYALTDQKFESYNNGQLKDQDGQLWKVAESKLTGPAGKKLDRLPAHEAFWFAWINAYPSTRLVK